MLDKNPKAMSTGKEVLPFSMGYLPESFQQKSFNELNDTPQNRIEGLQEIKKLMKAEEIFGDMEFDDEYLVMFLRCQSYDVKAAFERLKNMLSLKKSHMFMFTHQKYENIEICFIKNIVRFLPYRCPDGCAAMLINVDNWKPEEFPVVEVKRMAPILLFHALRDPMTQVNGFKAIIDAKSNPLKHLKHCTFQNLYLMYHGSQNCVPGIFHEYHLVNPSVLSRFCLSMWMPFLSEELKKKIHIHSSPKGLLDFFPPHMIPTCYGGELGDYDMTPWLREAMQPEMLETICGKPKSS
ncbi:Alpha-tocopherol transfer protein-like [Araneus ventricosus]|uniref:Alpha-tocopherol transfer protein-like n=1 Tax=Araneus ventricosus TaxID=182803 RepID=A0A4Y2MKN2_ARAVE|nr:Alpha-tocopherol transfer protein-like [Araneus ventricosus]